MQCRIHNLAYHEMFARGSGSAGWQSLGSRRGSLQLATPVRPHPSELLPRHSSPAVEARRCSSQSCSASGQTSRPESTAHLTTEYAPAYGCSMQPRSRRRAVRQMVRQVLRAGASLVVLLGARSPGWQVCLAAMCFSPSMSKGSWQNLKSNHVFLVGFWAWLMAQTMKIFTKRYKKGVWDIKAIVDSGGMPSSHSSLCMAVTTAVALEYGLASPLFAMSLCFSLIVMYDATGVRRHAGKQAEVLNIVIMEMLEGHPVRDVKLKEVLGHTPLQVLAGASLGILVGLLYPQPTLVAPV